jgi:hypothetical protein
LGLIKYNASNPKEDKRNMSITIINTSYHKKMTDNHLAQINFTAGMSRIMWDKYISKTNIDHPNLGRIRFMNIVGPDNDGEGVVVFGRVSHGYGYDISQDIENAIEYSKGVKK